MNVAAGVRHSDANAPPTLGAAGTERSYETWKAAALAHDAMSGTDRWRREDRSRRYDYRSSAVATTKSARSRRPAIRWHCCIT